MQHERFWRWFPWALLAVYVLPQWLCGQDTQLVVHDMLDSEVAHRTLLAKSGLLWTRDPDAIVPSILGGVPRGSLPSGFKLDAILFAWLSPYFAWNVHDTLVRGVALAGALRCAEVWVSGATTALPRDESLRPLAVVAAAVSFALAPWQSVTGLAIAGLPWLAWSWMRLYDAKPNWLAWLVWPAFAFWSNFAQCGPTLLIGLGVCWLLRAWKDKGFAWRPLAAMVLYLATMVVVEWPLIALTAKGYDHHRNAWDAVTLAKPFSGALGMAWQFLWVGQDHAPMYPRLGWLLLAAAVVAALRNGSVARERIRSITPAIAMLLVIALIHLLWQWRVIAALRQPFPPLRFIQMDRFYLLVGLPWIYITVRLGASFSYRAVKWLLFISPLWCFILSPPWVGLERTFSFHAGLIPKPPMTFRRFVAADLFADLQSSVQPSRVASLGMHPAVAQINGLSTVDGYLQIYPRRYKEKFRRVIAGRLERDPQAAWYFDAWGSRAYLGWPNALPPHDIEGLDTNALCQLGTDYVLSNGPVVPAQAARGGWSLRFHKTHPDSAWDLHAYRLPCSP
ncbi:MAG: hypothetical protein IPM54_30215 [Polyangiaceae bacterium]|nr:hypothetical protein [Polyangiaceae bacterium]